MIIFSSKGTILGVTKRTPTDKELHTCPHVSCLSAHEWDPQNVRFPKISRTMEEDISRNIGAVMTEGGSTDFDDTESEINSVYQIYDIGAMTSLIIGSVKIALIPSRNIYETKATLQDVPQAKTFKSKGGYSTVSPEELSERWQIVIEQARDAISKTTQRLARSAAMPLARLYKVERVFRTKSLTNMWATDTMDVRVNYLDGNRYAQVFSNGT